MRRALLGFARSLDIPLSGVLGLSDSHERISFLGGPD